MGQNSPPIQLTKTCNYFTFLSWFYSFQEEIYVWNKSDLDEIKSLQSLTLLRSGIFGSAQGWAAIRSSLPKICHTYPTVLKLHSYTLPKDDPKTIWITWRIPWVLLSISFFSSKISKICYVKKTVIDCTWYIISKSFKLFRIFNNCLNKNGFNFDEINKNSYSRAS